MADQSSPRHGRPRSDLPVSMPRRLRRRMTDQEVKLWNWLREDFGPMGFHFRRQVPIGRFVVDFACLKHKLVVEVDGGGHGHDGQARRDGERDRHLERLGFRVLRIWNNEIDRQKNVALDAVYAALHPEGSACAIPAGRQDQGQGDNRSAPDARGSSIG